MQRIISILPILLLGLISIQAQDLPPFITDTVHLSDCIDETGISLLKSNREPVHGLVVDFHPNGRRKLMKSVVNGKAHGLWMEWYENGSPRYMADWLNGKGEGLWAYFHDNGMVSERSQVKGDIWHGIAEGWHPNGKKAFEGYYHLNQKDGVWKEWSAEGVLASHNVFNKGEVAYTWVDEKEKN